MKKSNINSAKRRKRDILHQLIRPLNNKTKYSVLKCISFFVLFSIIIAIVICTFFPRVLFSRLIYMPITIIATGEYNEHSQGGTAVIIYEIISNNNQIDFESLSLTDGWEISEEYGTLFSNYNHPA